MIFEFRRERRAGFFQCGGGFEYCEEHWFERSVGAIIVNRRIKDEAY